jgi:hypothetical protein
MPLIHSALSGKGGICPSSDKKNEQRFYNDRIIAFQHDVCDPIVPIEFSLAKAIHVVIPWRDGYQKFVEYTIAKDSSFADYLDGMMGIINLLKIPTFILSGKQIGRTMKPDRLHEAYMSNYGGRSVYSVWNYGGVLPNSADEIEDFVGSEYGWVLDFSCGYGEIADHCKKAILTDVNTGCIDYIVSKYKLERG